MIEANKRLITANLNQGVTGIQGQLIGLYSSNLSAVATQVMKKAITIIKNYQILKLFHYRLRLQQDSRSLQSSEILIHRQRLLKKYQRIFIMPPSPYASVLHFLLYRSPQQWLCLAQAWPSRYANSLMCEALQIYSCR